MMPCVGMMSVYGRSPRSISLATVTLWLSSKMFPITGGGSRSTAIG